MKKSFLFYGILSVLLGLGVHTFLTHTFTIKGPNYDRYKLSPEQITIKKQSALFNDDSDAADALYLNYNYFGKERMQCEIWGYIWKKNELLKKDSEMEFKDYLHQYSIPNEFTLIRGFQSNISDIEWELIEKALAYDNPQSAKLLYEKHSAIYPNSDEAQFWFQIHRKNHAITTMWVDILDKEASTIDALKVRAEKGDVDAISRLQKYKEIRNLTIPPGFQSPLKER